MRHITYRSKIFFLCAVLAIGRFAFDMYFPSLLFIAEQFKVDYSVIERTVSAYLLGITFCQLLFGPLADCWGRKRVLILGFSLFIVGSVICIFSDDANTLIFGRLICGMGLSVGPCLKRALLVDWFDEKRVVAKASGTVSSALMVATVLAPYLGGLLQEYTNSWRLSFILISVWGLFILWYVLCFFKDIKKFDSVFRIKDILKDYLNIFYDREFMMFSIVSGCVFANTLVYFQIIPYIFAIDIETPAEYFGYAAAFAGLSYIAGGYLLYFWRHMPNRWVLRSALYLMIIAAALGGVFATLCQQRIYFAIPIALFFIAVRWFMPAAFAEAMVAHEKAGTASSVMGFIQYIASTILSYSFSLLNGGKVTGFFFADMLVLSVVSYVILRKYFVQFIRCV